MSRKDARLPKTLPSWWRGFLFFRNEKIRVKKTVALFRSESEKRNHVTVLLQNF
jgi:hypothetical protein